MTEARAPAVTFASVLGCEYLRGADGRRLTSSKGLPLTVRLRVSQDGWGRDTYRDASLHKVTDTNDIVVALMYRFV